jgi:hypothetical protein
MQGWVPLSRTPFLVLLAWVSLRLRRMRWRHIGLRRPERWTTAIVWGVAAGIAIEAFANLVTTPMIGALLGLLFLACGRTLTIPIIAHGVSNTLALVLMYFGMYPGLTG